MDIGGARWSECRRRKADAIEASRIRYRGDHATFSASSIELLRHTAVVAGFERSAPAVPLPPNSHRSTRPEDSSAGRPVAGSMRGVRLPNAPLRALDLDVPVRTLGDVNERCVDTHPRSRPESWAGPSVSSCLVWSRDENSSPMSPCDAMQPSGEVSPCGGSFRGDVFAWLRIDDPRSLSEMSCARSIVVPVPLLDGVGRRQHRCGFPTVLTNRSIAPTPATICR
jgi:hypothetical protein